MEFIILNTIGLTGVEAVQGRLSALEHTSFCRPKILRYSINICTGVITITLIMETKYSQALTKNYVPKTVEFGWV